MNKHRGSNFEDYLKERGISEEVSALAKERWKVLHPEAPDEVKNSAEVSDNSHKPISRFLHQLRHLVSHLFS